ncbi:MAG: hypothetical protein K0U74_02990 [Alphaproteobacteria bacterium]|nr:hypothetical protein [Alphaproteobacteria bacterium]
MGSLLVPEEREVRSGQVRVGQAPRASDGVPEVDLSEAGAAAYSGVQDIGGGFAQRALFWL